MFGNKPASPSFAKWTKNAEGQGLAPGKPSRWWQRWSIKRKAFLAAIVLLVITLAVGLGAGFAAGQDSEGREKRDNQPYDSARNQLWTPPVGATWNYMLRQTVDEDIAASDNTAEVWDIDLFDNDANAIDALHSAGKRALCYFSAGTFENWRPDKSDFDESDLGEALEEWEGEQWLDTTSDNVRKIMRARLDMAMEKECDGVEPDNIDAYDNENGLDLDESDAAEYVIFLASEAHFRNLSLALKNGARIISDVIDVVDYSVQEQCVKYDECSEFGAFIDANKPVFHVEYPKGDDANNSNDVDDKTERKICDNSAAARFSTIIKNMDLDQWVEPCSSYN